MDEPGILLLLFIYFLAFRLFFHVSELYVCISKSNLMASTQVLGKEWRLTHAFQEFAIIRIAIPNFSFSLSMFPPFA